MLLGIKGSSGSGQQQSIATEEEQHEIVSKGVNKENNQTFNVQTSANVEQSDGPRKEIP